MAAGHESDLFHHVRDFPYFEFPLGYRLELPRILGLQLTKFMVLQVVAGLFLVLVFRGLARRIQAGAPAKGPWWNFWELLAIYVRDNVVRPVIGTPHDDHGHGAHGDHGHGDHGHAGAGELTTGHPADKYAPYVWTAFFYVLICNLLGAFPWMGSATGEINVTGALAVVTVLTVIYYGTQRSGFFGFWKSLAPSMDLPLPLMIVLFPMIWLIELAGFVIKHTVLAIRLFANIMGGHTVLAVILGFIAVAANSGNNLMYGIVLPSSIFGQVAIGLLELLVAFLQAYIFAFLATVFISMAVNPH